MASLFTRQCCLAKTGPLVWGRMAALIARSTQSLFHSDRCRLQVFVDDLLTVAQGTDGQLDSIFKHCFDLVACVGLESCGKRLNG